MAVEDDAEHVEDFALHPVGPVPERERRRQRRVGVVDERLDEQPLAGGRVQQDVPDAETILRVGIVQVIGRRQLGEHVEAALVLEALHERVTAAPAATRTRRLSRNSEVVKASSPKRSRSFVKIVFVGHRPRLPSLQLVLQPRGRGRSRPGPTMRVGRRRSPGPAASALRRRSALAELAAAERAGPLDLVLQVDDRLQQLLRPRRAAGDVDVHRDEAVDALHDGVGVEDAAGGGAGAHRDAPFRLRHLQPDPLQHRHHLHRHPAGDDHQVALPRAEPHDLGAEAGDVVPRGAGGHQLDAAAGRGERHRPQAVLARPSWPAESQLASP